MGAKIWLGGMVAVSALVVATSARSGRERQPPVARGPLEAPWLTPEAAAQVIGPDGQLGPLFDHVMLGGPAPSPAERARIADFARTNHVKIDLDVADDELAAVRFEVMYGGCCGYEGADRLARRLGRPRIGGGCTGDASWLDDWAIAGDDGVYVRARVRVNRVVVRWEPQVTLDELLERADGLLGADRVAVAKHERDRWIEIEPSRSYRLEVPYALDASPLTYPANLGLQLATARGRVVEIAFSIRGQEDEASVLQTRARMLSRWGQPHVQHDQWTWRLPDRIITAELDSSTTNVTVAMR